MKFRKKPVVIEANQLTKESIYSLTVWCKGHVTYGAMSRENGISIPTLEGNMQADFGDWIIKGVKGEFYPCKPDIFKATYEQVEENQ